MDVDIVHSREPDNIGRLLRALDSLKPDASHLASHGHQRMTTRFGPLDVLGMIGRSRTYDALLPHTNNLEIGQGLRTREEKRRR